MSSSDITHQGAASAHAQWAVDERDGLRDSAHHRGDDLSLLGDRHRARLVNRDDWSAGRPRSGDDRGPAHLSGGGFQYSSGRVTDL